MVAIPRETPSDENNWSFTDPFNIRWRELEIELRSKVYEYTPEELAKFANEARTRLNPFTELKARVLDNPLGLIIYYNATCRHREIESILASEGLTRPTYEE